MSETAIAGSELAARGELLRARRVVFGANRATRLAAVVVFPIVAVELAFRPEVHWLHPAVLSAAVWFLALRSSYGQARFAPMGTTIITGIGTLTGLAAVSLLMVWLPGFTISAPQLLVTAAAVFATAALVDAFTKKLGARRRLLLVGADDGIRELLGELPRRSHLFDVVGVVADRADDTIGGIRRLGGIRELQPILREAQPDLVVLGAEASRAEALAQVLDFASPLDIRVMDVHHLHEYAFGKVPVQHLSPTWFMGVLHLYQPAYSRIVKRTFDVIVAGVALLLLLPVLAVVAATVRFSSRGPVFFRQLRLGEGGKIFSIFKFRTMVDGAEAPGAAVWAAVDDVRITGVGRVLRRTRIDELPQLWNVLRGEMSIVGPRPERPEFLELLRETVPFWTRRHLVKPGITGWAQVCHGYTADAMATADKLAYDLYYLKYRSLVFDIAIALRTVGIILTGFGSR
ncbi:MAG: exopolysaccharide biosynthesis polyprenyl glycosylphosphotransferase [Gaiellaceae bacterium]